MPKLDQPRWEEFAKQRAGGSKLSDAYLGSGFRVDAKKGRQRTTTATNRAGKLLRLHPEIGARIAELEDEYRAKAAEKADVDRAYVLNELKENIERSKAETPVLDRDGNQTGVYKREGSVINRGAELIGKELGMFADRVLTGTLDGELEGMSREQLRGFIRAACNEVGLRMIDMTDDQKREWIYTQAPKLDLIVTPASKPTPSSAQKSSELH